MTIKPSDRPTEYHEDDAAVMDCVEVLFAVEKRFGTSAFVDAVEETIKDPDFLARKDGARPLTAAYVHARIIAAIGEGYSRDSDEQPVATPFPARKRRAVPKSSPLLILSLGGMTVGSVLILAGLALHSLGLA